MIERRKKTSCLFTGMKTVLSSYELACGKCVVLFFFFLHFVVLLLDGGSFGSLL